MAADQISICLTAFLDANGDVQLVAGVDTQAGPDAESPTAVDPASQPAHQERTMNADQPKAARPRPDFVLIVAPPGAGKTTGIPALLAHFGLDWVEDDWDGVRPVPRGSLVLTNAPTRPLFSDIPVPTVYDPVFEVTISPAANPGTYWVTQRDRNRRDLRYLQKSLAGSLDHALALQRTLLAGEAPVAPVSDQRGA